MVTLQFIILTDNVYRKQYTASVLCKELVILQASEYALNMAIASMNNKLYRIAQSEYNQSLFNYKHVVLSRLKVHSLALLNR